MHVVRPPSCPAPRQDTEFPGVVARPIGQFTGNADYHYQTLRCNCDLLKIIQLVRIREFVEPWLHPCAELVGAMVALLALRSNTCRRSYPCLPCRA
jgi:hypothetical protein